MEFGPEIKVDGKRPEWLKDDETLEYRHSMDTMVDPMIAPARYDGWSDRDWKCVTAIRLPANHPHYATPTPDERAVAPELVSRMIEHLKDCGQAHNIRPRDPDAQRRYDEMKAIVAALEPVDPDKEIIDAMARAMWDNVGLFDPNLDTMRECAEYALQAYRQLEKEGK